MGMKQSLLRGAGFSDTEGIVLGTLSRFNSIMTKLDLSWNKVGDFGARAIANGLKVNFTLSELDLHCNKIGNIGAQDIADALKMNTQLKKVYLNVNIYMWKGQKALKAAILNHPSITRC